MIQFLQSTAKLSTCYSYIGVALRYAIRMGLHRSFNVNFTPIEAETRKRLFWVIRRMDTYVGAMLGLPHFLEDDDVDQDYPTEVDDEYITETEILPMPEGTISVMAASNAHVKIVQILSKICKHVYPTKGTQGGGNNAVTYSVSYSKIREIEQNMQQWLDELPMALKPGGEAPPIIIRSEISPYIVNIVLTVSQGTTIIENGFCTLTATSISTVPPLCIKHATRKNNG